MKGFIHNAEFVNVVICVHKNSSERFVFEVPPYIKIKQGERLYVHTKHGDTEATACYNSFWVEHNGALALSRGHKLEPVLGRLRTKQEVVPLENEEQLPF